MTPVVVPNSFQNESHSHGGADTDGAWFEGGVGTGIARGGRGILGEAIAQEESRDFGALLGDGMGLAHLGPEFTGQGQGFFFGRLDGHDPCLIAILTQPGGAQGDAADAVGASVDCAGGDGGDFLDVPQGAAHGLGDTEKGDFGGFGIGAIFLLVDRVDGHLGGLQVALANTSGLEGGNQLRHFFGFLGESGFEVGISQFDIEA